MVAAVQDRAQFGENGQACPEFMHSMAVAKTYRGGCAIGKPANGNACQSVSLSVGKPNGEGGALEPQNDAGIRLEILPAACGGNTTRVLGRISGGRDGDSRER